LIWGERNEGGGEKSQLEPNCYTTLHTFLTTGRGLKDIFNVVMKGDVWSPNYIARHPQATHASTTLYFIFIEIPNCPSINFIITKKTRRKVRKKPWMQVK